MISGGDIRTKGTDGSSRRPGLPDALASGPVADSIDRYMREGAPVVRPPDPFRRFASYFGDLIKTLFPEFFGIFGRVHKFIPEYKDFTLLESDSGGQFFYRIDDGGIVLAGNLYDISSLIHKFLDDPESLSMGSVVNIMRDGQSELASIGQGVLFSRPVTNPATLMIEVSMRPDPDSATSMEALRRRFKDVGDIFGAMEEYEIEEPVNGDAKYADVIAGLNRAIRGVRPRHSADVEMMITMKPPDAVFVAGLGVDRLDAGLRLDIDGKIKALTFRMLESGNEALWIGRLSQHSRAIFWEVEDIYPDDVDKIKRIEVLNRIALVFKPDVDHVLVGVGVINGKGMPPAAGGLGPTHGPGLPTPPVTTPPSAAMSIMTPLIAPLPIFLNGAMLMVK